MRKFFVITIIIGIALIAVALFGTVAIALWVNNPDLSISFLNAMVALTALVLSMMATALSIYTRMDPQRQKLYELQLESFREIEIATSDMILALIRFSDSNKKDDPKKIYEQWNAVVRKHTLYMPSKINSLLASFHDYFTHYILLDKDMMTGEASDEFDRVLGKMVSNYSILLDAIRQSIGADKLHQESLKLFETYKDYEKVKGYDPYVKV